MDKAGKDYWDGNWIDLPPPKLIDINDTSLRNYVNLKLHGVFSDLLKGERGKGKKLLEVGCARSVWLPHFARQFGLEVAGIDYSETGCNQEKALLDIADVKADVICADMFDPPVAMKGTFDFVVSFGVAEHFEDAEHCVAAMAKFLRPGGVIVTVVPNMLGTVGLMQRYLNEEVFATHVPHTPETLEKAHRAAGFHVISSSYFLSTNYYVVNIGRMANWRKKLLYRIAGRMSMLVWLVERWFGEAVCSRIFSPYILCTARSPD